MKTLAALTTVGVALTTLAATPAPTHSTDPVPWAVDPAHTEVGFSVKHFFTPVTGKFESFDVELVYDPENPEASTVEAVIDIGSVNTNNEKRDNHLRSGDFFEADAHPRMTFRSTSVEQVAPNRLVARGPLTIKGTTRQVEVPIEVLGVKEIPQEMREMLGGAEKVASFRATTTLDRRDFGVGVGSWAATAVVGKDVEVEITLEAALR